MGKAFQALQAGNQEEAQKLKMAFINEEMPKYLAECEKQLVASGGKFFADGALSIADIWMFTWLQNMQGFLTGLPADWLDETPALKAQYESIAAHPKVA